MAALLTMVSCQKEEVFPQDPAKDPVFTATIENNATKTTVDAANAKVAWVLNDEITVTDHSSPAVSVKYTVSAIDKNGKATFTKKKGESRTLGSGPYTATYGSAPSASQTYSTSAPSLPMSGVSGASDTNLKFTVTCGLLEITLTKAGESIKSIAVSDNAARPKTYTLDCGDGVGIASGTKFFIAVPAATYTSIAITNVSDRVCNKTDLSLAVAANHIKPVSSTNLVFLPEGALNGLFSVSKWTKVFFSKGNLQATYSTSTSSYTWDFAEHQYDYIGKAAGNTTIDSQTGGAKVDLFCWSTPATYYGINTSMEDSTYRGDFKDWGEVIDNKGTWRTLAGSSLEEWKYLLDLRTGDRAPDIGMQTDARYAEVKVNGKTGLLIFPDVFTWPEDSIEKPTTFNVGSLDWNGIDYTTTDFAKLESAGCVFLPAAGYRSGPYVHQVGEIGWYWSSTGDIMYCARSMFFYDEDVHSGGIDPRHFAYSVRLVTADK